MSKKSKAERTREEILDAAWALVSARGDAVSMAEIATAAGRTRQAVYTHFPSRGALLVALVRHADFRFDIWDAFGNAMAQSNADSRFDACLDAWFDFVPRIHPVASVLIRTRMQDADAAAAWTDRMDALRAFLAELLETVRAEGRLDPAWEVAEASDYLWTTISVQSWDLLVSDCNWPPERATARLKQAARKVLLAPPCA
ncbi:MAG: TetR family transcriptional regulator [Alphaproteobacteria bacterium]|nr:TetR family transcriptional regulator [Alphaproteobacteria bacterium]